MAAPPDPDTPPPPRVFVDANQAERLQRGDLASQRTGQPTNPWATAVANVTVGVIIADAQAPDWPINFANPAFCAITGYALDEILGRNCRFLQGAGTNRDTVDQLRAALGRREPFRGELLNYKKDGTPFWNEASISPVFDEDDRLTHYVGVTNDVTARKAAEQGQQESEERFRVLVESARDFGIFTMDLQGRVILWNPGAEKIFGWTAAEMIGQSGDRIFTPEDRATRQPQLEQETALREGCAEDERWHQRADGSRFWGSGVMMLLHHDGGDQPHGFLKILRDLTQRHQRQEERARLLAAERAAREEAEIANAAKDRFLAVLSHELRTPLTPVVMAVHLLGRLRDLPAAAREALATIQRNVEVETHLINDLLDVTGIARGKLEITRQPTDLHEAIRQAIETVADDVQAKSQRLTVALDAREHGLSGDPVRLQQVGWNLLKNASKFTPPGGAIRVATRDEPGRVVLEVSDTGIGFEAEAAGRIFDAFIQANDEVMRRFGGLGLGLAISKAIADAHGGQLSAHSAGPGQGATFTLSLPLAVPTGSAVSSGEAK